MIKQVVKAGKIFLSNKISLIVRCLSVKNVSFLFFMVSLKYFCPRIKAIRQITAGKRLGSR